MSRVAQSHLFGVKRAAIFSLFIVASLFAAAGLRAQGNPPASAAQKKNALAPVEFLIGSWQAQAETPGIGKFTTERSYQKIFSSRFIEMRETIRGEKRNIAARAIIGVDPASGKLTGWSWADDGSMTEIALMDAPAAEGLVFEGKFVGSGETSPLRSIIKKTATGFDEIIQVLRNGQWSTFTTMNFTPPVAAKQAETSQPRSLPITPNILPIPHSPLMPLDKFAGKWLIQGESEGQKFTVEYAFLWALGGHFMTTTYSIGMGGAPELHAMSIIGYDPQAKEIAQRGFNAEGSVLRAKVTVTGDTLVWEGQMVGARTQGLRSTYRLKDADTLEFTTEVKKGDAWESMGAAPMRREKP